MHNGKILSIAIPTYNRAQYLDRCLSFLYQQVIPESSVEIIVSDNCSTDNTREIVNKYISMGLVIKYYKNEKNEGMDYNFKKCYLKATGKYVLVFSDDDLIFPGAISKILSLLKTSDYGVIYLSHLKMSKLNIETIPIISKTKISIYSDYLSVLNKINHYISYISANIVNQKYITNQGFEEYMGSNLIHVPVILNAIQSAKFNVIIDTPTIGMQDGNSGGYNILKTFGDDFISIIKTFEPTIYKLLVKYLIFTSIPGCIFSLRMKNHNFIQDANPKALLKKHFSGTYYYFFVFLPILTFPLFASKLFLVFIRYFFKSVNYFPNIRHSRNILRKQIYLL